MDDDDGDGNGAGGKVIIMGKQGIPELRVIYQRWVIYLYRVHPDPYTVLPLYYH